MAVLIYSLHNKRKKYKFKNNVISDMVQKIRYILTIIFVAASSVMLAQQAPMFTNYSNSYAAVNPGFGGLSDGINVMGIYRDQWTGFKDMDGNSVAPKTLLFSGDMPVPFLKGGASLSIMNDKIGFEDNVNINLGYSFHADLGAGILGIGLALNMLNRSVDFGNFHPTVDNDPAIPQGDQSDMLIDANLGLFWQIPETFYVGMSVTNLFESKGKELSSSATTQVLEPNTYYVWDEVSELDLSFNEGNVNQTNEYVFQFKSGENTTTLLLPDNIKWANNIPPNINANKLYQISVLNNLGSILEFDA